MNHAHKILELNNIFTGYIMCLIIDNGSYYWKDNFIFNFNKYLGPLLIDGYFDFFLER
jgi:hypothetical protein